MQATDRTERALGLLGLAARARRVTVGTALICTALKTDKEKPLLVLEASDTSDNTHKRITDRTAFYGVKVIRLSADSARLAHAVGKRGAAVAAVGVSEPHLADAIAALFAAE